LSDHLHAPAALSWRGCFRYPVYGWVVGASRWARDIAAKTEVHLSLAQIDSRFFGHQTRTLVTAQAKMWKQCLWFPYAIVCEYPGNQIGSPEGGFCPGSVWNTEGSELETGVVQLGRWLSSRIMRVQVTELEVCCTQYSNAVDSLTFAQFWHDFMFRVSGYQCCGHSVLRITDAAHRNCSAEMSTTLGVCNW